MLDIFIMLLGSLWAALQLTWRLLKAAAGVALRRSSRGAVPAAEGATQAVGGASHSAAPVQPAAAPVVGAAPLGAVVSRQAAAVAGPRSYEPADRILLVTFGQGWSVTVRVYQQRKTAERTLRCNDPQMAADLRHTYFTNVFPMDAVSLEAHSLEAILRDCEVSAPLKAAELLKRLGDPQLQALPKGPAQVVAQTPATAVPAEPRVAPEMVQPESAPVPPAVAPARPTAKAAPAAAGPRVEGSVVNAGRKPSLHGGETFEVIIQTDGGEQTIKRGWQLQQLFDRLGVKVGDRIAITDLGRQPIEPAPGQEGGKKFKNTYDVQVVEHA